MPALAYVQLLGAPVQLSKNAPVQLSKRKSPEWADRPSFLLDPDLYPDPDPDLAPDLNSDLDADLEGRSHPFIGRRVAAIATPALVLGMVGALAVTLLTGHGPKFDVLSAHQANQPPQGNQSLGSWLATTPFSAYPGQQQRGLFESVNRIVASGDTIVATAQLSGVGFTRQLFYVSADGGATWQLAPVRGTPAPGHVAPLLAGGPGGWVAIGPQAIWTSQNGMSWTQAATHGISQIPGDQVWVVTKTAVGFLAGGSDAQNQGVLWTSPDGLNWHRQILGPRVLNIAYAAAHSNKVLITGTLADGGSGAWLSPDGGSTWTPVNIPGTGAIAGVAFNAAGFLAVRNLNAYFSQNGVTWHHAGTINATGGLRPRVVKGDAQGLVVAGQNDAGQLVAYLSTDNGASWRPTASLGNAAAESVVGAAVAPGDHIIAIGATAANPVGQRPVFVDASAHSARMISLPKTNLPAVAVTAITEAGGQQIAVGSADGYPAIWRKTAGTWSLVTQPGQFGTQGSLMSLTGVTHGPSGWLAVGANLILTSRDGVTWRAVGGTAALAAADLLAAAAGPAGYVLVGEQNTHSGPIPVGIWLSPDLTSWVKASGLTGSGKMLAVAAGSHGFAAVGSANGQPAVWASADGKTWTLTDLSPVGATLRQVAAQGNRIVVMGANAAGAPLAMLSVNGGSTWQPTVLPLTGLSSSGPGTVITALTADSAGFTAVGESGSPGREQLVAWTSPDGATWTLADVGAPGGNRAITALTSSGSAVTGIGDISTEQSQQLFTWTPPAH